MNEELSPRTLLDLRRQAQAAGEGRVEIEAETLQSLAVAAEQRIDLIKTMEEIASGALAERAMRHVARVALVGARQSRVLTHREPSEAFVG